MSSLATPRQRILIPLANPRTAADLVRIGAALLAPTGTLTALSIVEVDESSPLSEGAARARQARRLLQRVLEFTPRDVDVRTVVRIGRRASEGIAELAAEEQSELIIFGWGGRAGGAKGGGSSVFSPTIDEVVRDPPCDIGVVKQRGIGDVRRILVPVRGGPHAELALATADALGRSFGASVDVLHVISAGLDPVVRARAERALATFVSQHAGADARPLLVEGSDVGQAILKEADSADLIVMGATAGNTAEAQDDILFGALPDAIAHEARPTVMVVKTRRAPTPGDFEQRAAHPETLEAAEFAVGAPLFVAARVDRWFGESSFHHASTPTFAGWWSSRSGRA